MFIYLPKNHYVTSCDIMLWYHGVTWRHDVILWCHRPWWYYMRIPYGKSLEIAFFASWLDLDLGLQSQTSYSQGQLSYRILDVGSWRLPQFSSSQMYGSFSSYLKCRRHGQQSFFYTFECPSFSLVSICSSQIFPPISSRHKHWIDGWEWPRS